jgi:serine/threonine-protein kinase
MPAKTTKGKKKIGKYVIERQIGKGSAANIYLAKQDLLGRKLVIKELLPQYAFNDRIISRFRREAKVVSQLSHDAIVHIYDYWVRSHSYYIAMEYVQGQTLRQILSTTSYVPIHIAAIILYHVCRGLEHAHGYGVVHRDLKPANIIISNSGQVKILDFGIAHFQYDENLTSLGAVIGTYNYMSPEQALGKKVTPASDIFSLGILFYEMLTGFKPFAKDDKEEVLEKVIHKRIRPPGKLNPAVHGRFSRIIHKCLRKRPSRRYQDTREIKKRLEKYLRRYPLDHQLILKNYLQNLSPRKMDANWPPRYWGRVWYRLTHLRPRTYTFWILGLLLFGAAEYGLSVRGIGLKHQWRYVKEACQSVWNRLIPGHQEPVHPPSDVQKGIKETLENSNVKKSSSQSSK